jgi:hypothetical protein
VVRQKVLPHSVVDILGNKDCVSLGRVIGTLNVQKDAAKTVDILLILFDREHCPACRACPLSITYSRAINRNIPEIRDSAWHARARRGTEVGQLLTADNFPF